MEVVGEWREEGELYRRTGRGKEEDREGEGRLWERKRKARRGQRKRTKRCFIRESGKGER